MTSIKKKYVKITDKTLVDVKSAFEQYIKVASDEEINDMIETIHEEIAYRVLLEEATAEMHKAQERYNELTKGR